MRSDNHPHTVPLSIQFDSGASQPIHDYEWLCPTHHRAVHVVIDTLMRNAQAALVGIPPDERDAIDPIGGKFVKLYAALPNPRALRCEEAARFLSRQ